MQLTHNLQLLNCIVFILVQMDLSAFCGARCQDTVRRGSDGFLSGFAYLMRKDRHVCVFWTKMTAFWIVEGCCMVGVNKRFSCAYCFSH